MHLAQASFSVASFAASLTLAFLISLSPPARADEGVCQRSLTSAIHRVFPWPDVPAQMIAALHRRLDDPALSDDARAALRDALGRGAPDHVIRLLYPPAPNKEVWAGIAADPHELASNHPLRRDPHGLREMLAGTLRELTDPAAQNAWMTYFSRDPVVTVRRAAASTFLTWTDPARRDAFVTDPDIDQRERQERLLAAKPVLDRLSPPVRWAVIKCLVDMLDHPDQDVATALNGFDDPDLLRMWYADQLRGRLVLRSMRNFESVSDLGDARRYFAMNAGRALAQIGQTQVRLFMANEVTRLAGKNDKRAAFARQVLAWESVWTLLHREALERRLGNAVDEDQVLRALRERTFDDRGFWLARAERRRLVQCEYCPLRSWTRERYDQFEARLKR